MPSSPRPLALPGVHERLLSMLADLPRGRLLDLPAGQGAMSIEAAKLGYEVVAADVAPDRCAVPCVAADLDARLPWPNASFDVVLCAEGIEHVESHFHTMRELRRVLRPGGTLLLSTPNPLSLTARLERLLTGFDDVSPVPIRSDESRVSAHHINPLDLPKLELLARLNGLEIRSIQANRLRWGSMGLAVLLGPWVAVATLWRLRARGRPAPMPAVHARLRRWLLSPAALLGRVLVVELGRRGTA